MWSTDASGVITNQGRWMTGDQMEMGGYEDVFKRDFNNDGITGVGVPVLSGNTIKAPSCLRVIQPQSN